MHQIQKFIIKQLMFNTSCRYSQLKPPEVEGNLFVYHLSQLLKEGLISKRSDGQYELSGAGRIYADRLSLKSFTTRVQPKIVTLIGCQNSEGQWLLYRRKRQPLIGKAGFPYGKIHLGESVPEAAERELYEKTGLRTRLRHRGNGYLTIYQGQELLTQLLFHFFYGHDPAGVLEPFTPDGKAFWAELGSHDLMPGTVGIVQLHHNTAPDNQFFADLVYKI